MVEKNYIILAHKNPEQIFRLIRSLDDSSSKFFVHVDLKSDLSSFGILESCSNISIIPQRENCIWGDFSIVKATLHLLKNVVESGNKGFTILLSGQDYPIKSPQKLNDFLGINKESNFIDIQKVEDKWSKKMVRDKIEHYHFIHSQERGHSNSYSPFFRSSLKQKFRTLFHLLKGRLPFETFQKLLELPQRIPVFTQQYGGSQWWAFNEKTTENLNSYIENNYQKLEDYYRFTSAPDEIFFHSVLMNILSAEKKDHLKPSLTYTNWERKNCILPVTFDTNDLQELSAVDHFFARKFDIDYDQEIFNLIDNKLLKD
ncbi:beta-1,6-N-acetylglucosaminyltransferase [Kaistella polysaccharea]|uniref:beta-1,6-N-acetylglucosaminyltransferase n=1 Tax=Kaistella polysaccharea TaxID=2878534 RepID=UPI001CF37B33|nr:beta-1,6-N-acetylglucosaminyltransferase [Kaistella polysaccharea]